VRLTDVTTSYRDGWVRLTGSVQRSDGATAEVYFEYPAQYEDWLCATGDTFLPVLLVPALLNGEPLHIDPPVSNEMVIWGEQLQELYVNAYMNSGARITIDAPNRAPVPQPVHDHVAEFFSLGVDSFYALLKNMQGLPSRALPITHLLYIEGLDTPLSQMESAEATHDAVRQVADDAGKELILGRTNVRDVFAIDHLRYYSGPCLASIGLSLCRGLKQAIVASATDYKSLSSSATHPLVEGRVETGHFRMIYEGCELCRVDRITKFVGIDPLSLKHLRVCTQNRSGMYNCGRCQKCLRTMVTLHLLGTLDRAETFPQQFTPKTVRMLTVRHDSDLKYLEEIERYAKATNADPAVTREVQRVMRIHHRWDRWDTRLAGTPLRWLVPTLDRLWRRARRIKKRLRGEQSTIPARSPALDPEKKKHAPRKRPAAMVDNR